ncbi:site-specific DNA-methyltransferase [bacterium]|nr:site-specific DNA-methyltransferase [bacterium]MBU1636265.1 site-specific DNA-methyltransferase [bacterium]
MTLPVHRWFRFSAGFSAEWAEKVICDASLQGNVTVLDPFVGSGTVLLAAEYVGVRSLGIEAHPFIYKIARAKLAWRSDPDRYLRLVQQLRRVAKNLAPQISGYPPLISRCFDERTLHFLDTLRQAYQQIYDESPESELLWLTLVASLRRVSNVGTAQWQYILPNKRKRMQQHPEAVFDTITAMFYEDMQFGKSIDGPRAELLRSDARDCHEIDSRSVNLVITSPPYPNNYDYADATRFEMSFMGEINGWGDLQRTVRQYLVRSCSQHVPDGSINLASILSNPLLQPISHELSDVCEQLGEIRLTKGGRKTYHLMVAAYFLDLAKTWVALRRVCTSPSRVCFVIGDSAPYGVYVPVIPWLGKLAIAAGFCSYSFEKTRDRNIKWKNRKHRVPLQEGQLWVEG